MYNNVIFFKQWIDTKPIYPEQHLVRRLSGSGTAWVVYDRSNFEHGGTVDGHAACCSEPNRRSTTTSVLNGSRSTSLLMSLTRRIATESYDIVRRPCCISVLHADHVVCCCERGGSLERTTTLNWWLRACTTATHTSHLRQPPYRPRRSAPPQSAQRQFNRAWRQTVTMCTSIIRRRRRCWKRFAHTFINIVTGVDVSLNDGRRASYFCRQRHVFVASFSLVWLDVRWVKLRNGWSCRRGTISFRRNIFVYFPCCYRSLRRFRCTLVWLQMRLKTCIKWRVSHLCRWQYIKIKSNLTRCRPNGRNRTVPPCSVCRRTGHAPGPAAPTAHACYRRRQTTPTDERAKQYCPLGGPVISSGGRHSLLHDVECLWAIVRSPTVDCDVFVSGRPW